MVKNKRPRLTFSGPTRKVKRYEIITDHPFQYDNEVVSSERPKTKTKEPEVQSSAPTLRTSEYIRKYGRIFSDESTTEELLNGPNWYKMTYKDSKGKLLTAKPPMDLRPKPPYMQLYSLTQPYPVIPGRPPIKPNYQNKFAMALYNLSLKSAIDKNDQNNANTNTFKGISKIESKPKTKTCVKKTVNATKVGVKPIIDSKLGPAKTTQAVKPATKFSKKGRAKVQSSHKEPAKPRLGFGSSAPRPGFINIPRTTVVAAKNVGNQKKLQNTNAEQIAKPPKTRKTVKVPKNAIGPQSPKPSNSIKRKTAIWPEASKTPKPITSIDSIWPDQLTKVSKSRTPKKIMWAESPESSKSSELHKSTKLLKSPEPSKSLEPLKSPELHKSTKILKSPEPSKSLEPPKAAQTPNSPLELKSILKPQFSNVYLSTDYVSGVVKHIEDHLADMMKANQILQEKIHQERAECANIKADCAAIECRMDIETEKVKNHLFITDDINNYRLWNATPDYR